MNGALHRLLASPLDASPIPTLDAFRARFAATPVAATSVERAILGGLVADRIAWAFAAGYDAALRALVPDLPPGVVSLCATERGGAHPRAIETTLVLSPGGELRLDGEKRWATIASSALVLLVLAREADDASREARARPSLRLVRVPGDAPGVRFTPMPPTPFAPEMGHAEVKLDDVRLPASALLPGDGWDAYVKPFRTVEDLHVHAALVAHLAREIRRVGLPRPLLARAAAVLAAIRALAGDDPSSPATHVALAGTIDLATALVAEVDAAWRATGDEAHARFERDRALLAVASNARGDRLARAWERLG